MANELPVADLGRVSDFLDGLHDAKIQGDKRALKAAAEAALVYASLRAWSVYRHKGNKVRR